jgi:hypothetical protein
MQFLPILITIILGVLALGFVLYPFYRHTPARPEQADEAIGAQDASLTRAKSPANGHSTEDQAQGVDTTVRVQTDREQAARSALREIELDYQLGNISEADYRTLRERYVRRALVALKSRYEHEQELDEAIEAQLRQMREAHDNSN